MQHTTEAMDKAHDRETGEIEDGSILRVPCEVYSRIVGYLRPIQSWHQGKRREFNERKTFHVPEVVPPEKELR